MSSLNYYSSSSAGSNSDCMPTDPQVASDAENNHLAEKEVTSPIGPMPFPAQSPQVIQATEIPPVRQNPGSEPSTPLAVMPLSFRPPASSIPPVNKQKRERIGRWDVIDREEMKKDMAWLPIGWKILKYERLNGRVDYEYLDLEGHRFRSKKEVVAYKQYGILPKRAARRRLPKNIFKPDQGKKEKEDEEKVEEEAPARPEHDKGWL